jgi:hypothetical protein
MAKIIYCIFLALSLNSFSFAEFTASTSKKTYHINEPITLTLSDESSITLSATNIEELKQHFEVLQQSSRSQSSYINGRTSNSYSYILTLRAKKEGSHTIPRFSNQGKYTDPISLTITQKPNALNNKNNNSSPGLSPYIETRITVPSAYIQEQFNITWKLYSPSRISRSELKNFDLPNMQYELIAQKDYRENVNGKNLFINEISVAVFAKRSGKYTIPSFSMIAYIDDPQYMSRNGFFQYSTPQQMMTPPAHITIKPIPSIHSSGWLPSFKVTLDETWEQNLQTIKTGDTLKRRITLNVWGALSEHIPKLSFSETPNLKQYISSPSSSTNIVDDYLKTQVNYDVTLIPTQSGKYTLPEISITWWNTQTNQSVVSTLPAKTIDILDKSGDVSNNVHTAPKENSSLPNKPNSDTSETRTYEFLSRSHVYLLLAIVIVLITCAFIYVVIARKKKACNPYLSELQTLDDTYTAEESAHLLLNWAQYEWRDKTILSLSDLIEHLPNHNTESLKDEIKHLNHLIYSPHQDSKPQHWRPSQLINSIIEYNGRQEKVNKTKSVDLPDLYP